MKILLTVISGFAVIFPALAETPKTPPAPILVLVKAKLEKELSSLDPKPSFKIPEEGYRGDCLIVKFKTKEYDVHLRSKGGRDPEKTEKEEGPSDEGFFLKAFIQPLGDINQALTPQVINEEYWKLFLDVYPVKAANKQIYFGLAYNSKTDQKLIDKIKKLTQEACEEFGKKVAEQPATDAVSKNRVATKEQEKEIRALIEQLVFSESKAQKEPLISPGITNNSEEYRAKFKRCQDAFQKLSEFKELAFPFLAQHLKDERQSIPFRNHYLGFTVGDACYWNIYFQLLDKPKDYSFYGYSRKGRDGQLHVKPNEEGSPFDEAGGLVKWLEANKELSYTEQQIKCLNWLLEKEKAIGASDAESYFVNILPLEIHILARKFELGQDVKTELDRLRLIKNDRRASDVPAELLPNK